MNLKAGSQTASLDRLEQVLPRYVNGGCLSRYDLVSALVWPAKPFRRNAPTLLQLQVALQAGSDKTTRGELQQVEVAPYAGANTYVHRMMEWLRSVQDDLFGAYVHGSLGTYEEIAYSDFDALVILRDAVFEQPERLARVAQFLNSARRIMLDYDPLQHHGWFVLAEAQLRCYPDHYFPLALFAHAKALLPSQGLGFEVHVCTSVTHRQHAFDQLSRSIVIRIEKRDYPANLYELKFLLSQFMLLPALYVQARDNRGIFKKVGFELARPDFSERDWAIMDKVSAIRANWSCEIVSLRRWLLMQTSSSLHRLAKRLAPAVPPTLKGELGDDFYNRMKSLALRMQDVLRVQLKRDCLSTKQM